MRRLALCIGNNAYSLMSPLTCAVQDASAVSNKLVNLGFETELATDLDRSGMQRVIFDFTSKLEEYDAAVLYYAGHGFQVENENILAPIDLNINNAENIVRMDAFPLSAIMREFDKYTDMTKIIILDACRDILGTRGTAKGFDPMLAPRGTLIAFSTSPGQVAMENSSTGHGRYTEVLLRYINLSRVPVETVFKKTRELLAGMTENTQIPWEHTSLIGEFYFNPDTIYCGMTYSLDAYADSAFSVTSDSLREIMSDLRSCNWDFQRSAIRKIQGLNYSDVKASELFVLGRNLYQAADENCYDAQRFIDRFILNTNIPENAKVHIFNGMAYEIYFDSDNNVREKIKTGKSYYQKVIEYLERENFYGCQTFIVDKIHGLTDRPLYIPGQNENMDFLIKIHSEEEGECVDDIIYQGKSVYRDLEGAEKPNPMEYFDEVDYESWRKQVAEIVAAPIDRVSFQFAPSRENNRKLLIPFNGFCLRF